MNAYDAYKKYVAIKLHFQGNYDYFKFSGGVKLSRDKFETRRDKVFFERIAKLYNEKQLEQLLVSNFIQDKDVWVGDLMSDTCRTRYTEWKKTQQSLDYVFSEDMLKLQELIIGGSVDSFDDLFKVPHDESFPVLVSFLFHKEIKLESFIIMNKILNFMKRFDDMVKDDIVYPELRKLVYKYSPFLVVDVNRFKKTMQKTFVQNSLAQSA